MRPHSRQEAHPRSRGENPFSNLQMTTCAGSSPLTRGKPVRWVDQCPEWGLIPAHAGKTTSHGAWGGRGWAHPRSRGENGVSKNTKAPRAGSSPLTRGKHDLRDRLSPESRLIPAHAGKTSSHHTGWARCAAHPRSRGENLISMASVTSLCGSSPLTRGKRRIGRHEACRARLIPAHAGKTHSRPPKRSPQGAHPRSRGENFLNLTDSRPNAGSSPLTRGKQNHHGTNLRDDGLIPAHAGKTLRVPRRYCEGKAHPRSRGENSARALTVSCHVGSSPLTRGKPARLDRMV